MALVARCWFGGCIKPGRKGKLAGQAVCLCARHVAALEGALGQPDRFEVRWGEWGRDVIARRERHIEDLREQLARLPEDEYSAMRWEPTERERLEWSIDDLARDLAAIHPDSPPIITIRERTHYIVEEVRPTERR